MEMCLDLSQELERACGVILQRLATQHHSDRDQNE